MGGNTIRVSRNLRRIWNSLALKTCEKTKTIKWSNGPVPEVAEIVWSL